MPISSDEVNYLVYRYLKESGFTHSAFTFSFESVLMKSPVLEYDIPPGALVTFLQKGLAYVGLEEHVNEDGTERQCDEELSLVIPHMCQTKKRKGTKNRRNSKAKVVQQPLQQQSGGAVAAAASTASLNMLASTASGENGTSLSVLPAKEEVTRNEQWQQNGPQPMVEESTPTPPVESTVVDPKAVALLASHCSEVFVCAWKPKSNYLASGSGDSTARIWDIGSDFMGNAASEPAVNSCIVLEHSTEIGGGNKDVTSLDWNKEGTQLATGSYDGVARVWSDSGELKHVLQAHDGPIFNLKWNNSGNYLLSGSSDHSAIVWNVNEGTVEQRVEFHHAPTLDVDWRDDTTFATCSTDKMINVIRVGEKQPLMTFVGHTDEVNAIKWDPNGVMLASCSDDYTAKIWKPDRPSCVSDLRDHSKEIYTIKWGPRQDRNPILASASFDSTVKLWDVELGSVLYSLTRHDDPVYSVAFSPSGDLLASGSFAGHLHIWNVHDGTLVKSYQGVGDIFEVSWNDAEDRVAACFSTNVVAVIDLRM